MLNNKVLSLKEKINCVSSIQVSSVRVSHKYPRFSYQFCTQVRAMIDYILPVMFPTNNVIYQYKDICTQTVCVKLTVFPQVKSIPIKFHINIEHLTIRFHKSRQYEIMCY